MNSVKKRVLRKRYRESKKRKREWLEDRIKEIKKSVHKLSSSGVPEVAYLYLVKGLNSVDSKKWIRST